MRHKLAEVRRDILNFTCAVNGETSVDAYGKNGSFHHASLEMEYQKRLVVSII